MVARASAVTELPLDVRIRVGDQARVASARAAGRRWQLCWLLLGPGMLVMLAENDGPSMTSYLATGALYGLRFFLPFLLVTFAFAAVCQEMCARVATVTKKGFGDLLLQRFGPSWARFAAIDLLATNVVTLVAEFVAMRIGLSYFGAPALAAVIVGVVLVAGSHCAGRYWRWERIALTLGVGNVVFVLVALLTRPPWLSLSHGLAHAWTLPGGSRSTLLLEIASTLGATITPWMVYFQQGATADKGLRVADLRYGRLDTWFGAAAAATCGCGALLVGSRLRAHGALGGSVLASAGFPEALARDFGPVVGALCALGLVEAGAVALLTISASTAYAASDCLGITASFNRAPWRARIFSGINVGVAALAGVVVLVPRAPVLSIALNANALAAVFVPVTLVFVLLMANDRELMGRWRNTRRNNLLGLAVAICVAGSAAGYGVDAFCGALHTL